MRCLTNLLVTGGAGFIGSNFIRTLFANRSFTGSVVNLDNLTYAGNLENLSDVERQYGGQRYFFKKSDICDYGSIFSIFTEYEIDTVVHLAAESHVDRSIHGPKQFMQTNIMGTFNLLQAAREAWKGREDVLFHHVSTDEVFGSLGSSGYFDEETPYDPRSPYSASKAASDHIVRAMSYTYGLPVTLSNCTNNYGPYQFPEKLIPLIILNILGEKPLPVYGDGKNVRDWLYVEDHCHAIWLILNSGQNGHTYAIGGENEWENIRLVHVICEKIAVLKGRDRESYKSLINFVKDRPGHDRRYAMDCKKIKRELGWSPSLDFSQGLDRTIKWYMENPKWVAGVRSGEYKKWYEKNYESRPR